MVSPEAQHQGSRLRTSEGHLLAHGMTTVVNIIPEGRGVEDNFPPDMADVCEGDDRWQQKHFPLWHTDLIKGSGVHGMNLGVRCFLAGEMKNDDKNICG